MRGRTYTTDSRLADDDMHELVDELAMKLYASLGSKVYLLGRPDIADLIQPYVNDLADEDRDAIPWLLWDLFQEGMDVEFG